MWRLEVANLWGGTLCQCPGACSQELKGLTILVSLGLIATASVRTRAEVAEGSGVGRLVATVHSPLSFATMACLVSGGVMMAEGMMREYV